MRRHLLAATALLAAGPALAQTAAPPADRPWTNPQLTPERRAELLAAQLTEDEQLALVHGVFPMLMRERPPGALQSAGYVPGVPRLGIPALTESDASLGVANAGRKDDDAVALPSGLALASTWDVDLAYAGGAMIGKEAREKGFNVLLAGGVNLVREPRNGRNFEYVGEDPLLAGMIAGASIRGIQSNHIVSTTKHYVLNAQETGRQGLDAVIDPAALREADLLAFEIAVEQGRPGSAMCSYNRVNGVYACENPYDFKALKGDWGWRGWVMSDWGAVHSVQAAAAGLDQESGEQLDKQVYFGAPLKAAIASGEIPAARLHDMAQRILWGMFSTGLMDDPVRAGGLDTAADAAVAERAAAQGIVLLKTTPGLLPLAAHAGHVVVIGGHADIGVLSGGGSSQVIPLGSHRFPPDPGAPTWSAGIVYDPSAPLAAIQARAGQGRVIFDPGADPAAAARAAQGADVAIVFATQWATEGQDVPLTLRDDQDALIRAVASTNPHTVVVLETGGPVLMPWLDQVGAVLEAWYPGQRGGEAIARVLYGEVDPSGRLPVSFPASVADLPEPRLAGEGVLPAEGMPTAALPPLKVDYVEGADVGYRWYQKTGRRPLFPFGYGLSYTRFGYDGLQVRGGETLTVSFEVANTGQRAGAETAQVYAEAPGRTARLIGWRKVTLQPGETRRVSITADRRLLARFDTQANDWAIPGGDYRVTVGRYAGDAALSATAHVDPGRQRP